MSNNTNNSSFTYGRSDALAKREPNPFYYADKDYDKGYNAGKIELEKKAKRKN